jgi:Zn-dependent protease
VSERSSVGPRRPGFGRGVFIGRLFGIEFYLDYSWFLIAAVITYTWTYSVFPKQEGVPPHSIPVYWVMGSAATFLFFVSLLLHELGHSLVSQKCGIPVSRITLLFIGGVAEISREPDDAKSELKIAIGGPAVSVGLAMMFFGAAGLFQLAHLEAASAVCRWLSFTNVMLVVFNMIPGYPLDGGRILRAILWHYTGKLHRATFITTRIGIGFSWLLIIGGVAILVLAPQWGGLVYILIGFFLKSAAEAGYANAVQREVLAGVSVRDIMTKSPVCLPDTLPLNLAVDDYFLTNHHEALPVIAEDGEFRGLLRIEHMKDVPRERWPYVSTGDLVAEKQTQLMKLEADTTASRAMRRLLSAGFGRLAVTEDGKIVGMITRHDILHFIKIHIELEA